MLTLSAYKQLDRMQEPYYLPQQYGPLAGEGGPGTSKL